LNGGNDGRKISLPNAGQAKEQVMSNKKGPPDFRDAGTGKFVTEKYADKHPKTTEKEHNRPPPPPPKKK
jgi:hypothetical protein